MDDRIHEMVLLAAEMAEKPTWEDAHETLGIRQAAYSPILMHVNTLQGGLNMLAGVSKNPEKNEELITNLASNLEWIACSLEDFFILTPDCRMGILATELHTKLIDYHCAVLSPGD